MARTLAGTVLGGLLAGASLVAPSPVTGALPGRPPAVPAAVPIPPRLAPPIPLARGTFLVARRGLPDPHFQETVVLLVHYEAAGAMGIIVNRPSHVALAELFPSISELRRRPDPVFLGGPVAHERMLFLFRAASPPASGTPVFSDVFVSSSPDLLRETVRRAGDRPVFRVFVGQAGWGPGQLDREIARGDWHLVTADTETVFETRPSEIWPTLIQGKGGRVAGTPTRGTPVARAGERSPSWR